MRINKYISQAGVASRRQADKLVENGAVKINGAVMREPGYDVQDGDRVEINGRPIGSMEKKEYVLVNKPLGVITSAKDEQDRPTVMELVKDIDARLFPVGRLDFNTSGALLMTNDGDIAYRLAHPRHQVYKTYIARVSGVVSKEKLWELRKGVDIGGYKTLPARVSIVKGTKNSTILEISISEGKNRQVRKMCKAVGNPVQDLERVAIGEIRLGHLQTGHYRKLTAKELEFLKGL